MPDLRLVYTLREIKQLLAKKHHVEESCVSNFQGEVLYHYIPEIGDQEIDDDFYLIEVIIPDRESIK